MKICSKCGENIKDITQLKEVGSLGIALRGKCPNCSAWIWAGDLWKKTKEIDRTNPPKKAAVKNSAKTADSFTPKPAKNPAKGLNLQPSLQPEGASAKPIIGLENQHLHKLNKAWRVANNG